MMRFSSSLVSSITAISSVPFAHYMIGPLRVREVESVDCCFAQLILSLRHLNLNCDLFAGWAKIPRELVRNEIIG